MKLAFCITLTISCVIAYQNSDEFIAEINNKQNLWRAGRNFGKNTPLSEMRQLLGMKSLPKDMLRQIPVKEYNIESTQIPELFDARSHWSNCKSVKVVADQSACGSCWVSYADKMIKKKA